MQDKAAGQEKMAEQFLVLYFDGGDWGGDRVRAKQTLLEMLRCVEAQGAARGAKECREAMGV